MKTQTTVFFALTAIASLGLMAGACHRHHGEMSPERIDKIVSFHLEDALDELEATDGQKRQIMLVKDQLLADVLALREEHRSDKVVFLGQMMSDKPDRELLHKLLDKRMDVVRSVAHKGLDSLLDVHGTLTPEQRTMLKAKVAKRHGSCAFSGK